MMAMTITMPLAKVPIAAQRPASDRSIVFESPAEELALLERERERLLDELLHFAAPDLGRVELHARKRVLDRVGELLVRGLEHLERAGFVAARGVDDELGEHLTFDVRRPQHVGIREARGARDLGDLLLDLELEVRLVSDRGRATDDA